MDDQETIKRTKSFGLNTYEAKIWIALLSRGTATAGELSDIANVPRSRSYDVLESLEKKGFVVTNPGKPIKYQAIPPKDVLENIKKRIEKNTEKHLSGIRSVNFTNLINTFQELYEKNINPTENTVAILKGRKNIFKHLDFLFKNTKRDILFSIEKETNSNLKMIKSVGNKTKKVTIISSLGLRMCVVGEDNTLIFPISEGEVHPEYDLCVWVKNEHTAKFLKQLLTSF